MIKRNQIKYFVIFIFLTFLILLSINISISALDTAEEALYQADENKDAIYELEGAIDGLQSDIDDLEWKLKWE